MAAEPFPNTRRATGCNAIRNRDIAGPQARQTNPAMSLALCFRGLRVTAGAIPPPPLTPRSELSPLDAPDHPAMRRHHLVAARRGWLTSDGSRRSLHLRRSDHRGSFRLSLTGEAGAAAAPLPASPAGSAGSRGRRSYPYSGERSTDFDAGAAARNGYAAHDTAPRLPLGPIALATQLLAAQLAPEVCSSRLVRVDPPVEVPVADATGS